MGLKLFSELKKGDILEQPFVKIDFSKSPLINTSIFRDKLMNIDSLTDEELYKLLTDNYNTLFSDIFIKNDVMYLELFTNSKFLQSITAVMGTVYQIDANTRTYCNKLVYDYLTCGNGEPYIKSLMLSFAKIVNRDIVPIITGIGIPEDIAAELVMARYSSLKEMVNVKRLNFIIESSPLEIMTEQNIVFIYERLFKKITLLFEGIMFDGDCGELSESGQEIYSYISLAVLDMLNNMPTLSIRKVLSAYSADYLMVFRNHRLRFSMRALSNDYYRIVQVVDALQKEGVYIP